MTTHWLAPFTSRNRWKEQQAACGLYINPRQHSTEPTCAECQKYLSAERVLDAELDATFADETDPRRI